MGKENVVYTHNGMFFFSHEKVENASAWDNMVESRKHYAEWNKPGIKEEYCIVVLM